MKTQGWKRRINTEEFTTHEGLPHPLTSDNKYTHQTIKKQGVSRFMCHNWFLIICDTEPPSVLYIIFIYK